MNHAKIKKNEKKNLFLNFDFIDWFEIYKKKIMIIMKDVNNKWTLIDWLVYSSYTFILETKLSNDLGLIIE